MKRPSLELVRSIRSDGPAVDEDGHVRRATPCPECQGPIGRGEDITKLWRQWFHTSCAKEVITAADVREAWRLIAMDAARSPRAYSTKEMRVVLEHMLQVSQVDDLVDEFGDEAMERFAR